MVVVIVKIVVILLLGWMPMSLLFSPIPPKRGSRWYPDPDRWDYSSLLLAYAVLNNGGTRSCKVPTFSIFSLALFGHSTK